MPDTRIYVPIESDREEESEQTNDVVWPTMIPDDEPPLKGLTIDFFRGDTIPDGQGWKIIPEWCGEPTTKGSASFTESEMGLYKIRPVDITWTYRGNDFLVAPSVIEHQYGSENPDRWNRMPLTGVDVGTSPENSDRDSAKRWKLTDSMSSRYSTVNLRCTLKHKADEEEPKLDTGPDLKLDNKQKGRWKYLMGDVGKDKALQYKTTPSAGGRFGIQVQEVGTKTFCHYVNQDNFVAGGPVGYMAEWLEPEGIFYSPFDTTDTEKFKVTRQPLFTADEVSGLFLNVMRRNRVEIYLMPRRWAFYTYHSVAHATTDLGEMLVVENCNQHIAGSILENPYFGCSGGDVFETVSECTLQNNCDRIDYMNWGGTVVDCEGTCHGWDTHWSLTEWCCVTFEQNTTYYWENGCKANNTITVSPCMEGTGTCGSPACLPCVGGRDIAVQRTIAFHAELHEETINVCLWWDSPPIDFKMRGPKDVTAPVSIYHWTGASYAPTDFSFIGDESLAEAVDNADNAGGDPDAVIGGYNSIHVMGSSCWTQIHATKQKRGEYWALWNFVYNAPDFQPFQWEESTGSYLGVLDEHLKPSDEDCMEQIAAHMERSRFFQMEFPPDGAYGEIGVGISPNKAGSLCAVIKIGGKVFFVWRKTDEEFISRDLHIAGPSFAKPLVPFVPRFPTSDHYYCFDSWQHFDGEGRKLNRILFNKHVECARKSDYGIDRNHAPGEGDVSTFIVNDSGAGLVPLEMPVYLIAAKSRADESQTYTYKMLMQEIPGGFAEHSNVANQY